MTLGIAPATFISTKHISGTSPSPSSLAARAGNSDVTSGVAVNKIEINWELSTLFACSAFDKSSAVDLSRC
jgi:hypothetical protein